MATKDFVPIPTARLFPQFNEENGLPASFTNTIMLTEEHNEYNNDDGKFPHIRHQNDSFWARTLSLLFLWLLGWSDEMVA